MTDSTASLPDGQARSDRVAVVPLRPDGERAGGRRPAGGPARIRRTVYLAEAGLAILAHAGPGMLGVTVAPHTARR